MKICDKHWGDLKAMVARVGLSHLDTAETAPAESYDTFKAGALITKACAAGDPPPFWPTLAITSALYSNAADRYGMLVLAGDPSSPSGHHCPLCLDLQAFQQHQRGECPDPDCQVQLKPEDKPWDEQSLDELAEQVTAHCRDSGITVLQ